MRKPSKPNQLISGMLSRAVKQVAPRGTQIVYLPPHVQEKYSSPDGSISKEALLDDDAEYGFVTTPTLDGAFCRFWLPGENNLKNIGNSAQAPYSSLFLYRSRPAELVEKMLAKYCSDAVFTPFDARTR